MISTLVVLLATCNLLISRVYSLKLTPVQRTKHRLDIHEECEKFLSAVQNAHKKVLEDEMNVIDQRVTLDSDELKKLRLLVNRWNSIDDKLRDINALSASQNKNPIYEDIHYYLATSKVIIGKLLVKSDILDPLLHELKDSCKSVWKYTSTYRSLETYSWLDCYSVLHDMAKSAPSGDEMVEIASHLQMSIPWLSDVLLLEGTDCSHQQCDAAKYLDEFYNLASGDKITLGSKLRYAWMQMNQLRLQLHSIVEGFLFASLEGSARLQRSLYADAQKAIEDMNIALYQDADKDLTTLQVSSSIDRKSLRNVLVDQINDEYNRYLSVMSGILEDGSRYLDDISSGHHVDLTHRPTIGFKSKLEVIEFFYKIIVSIQDKELESHRQYGAEAPLKDQPDTLPQRQKSTFKKTSARRREVPPASKKQRSNKAGEQETPKEAVGAGTFSRRDEAYLDYLSAVTSCMQYLLMLGALYAVTAMCGGHYLRTLKVKAPSSKTGNKRHVAPSGIPTINCTATVGTDYPSSRFDRDPSPCLRNITGTQLTMSILAMQSIVEIQRANVMLFNHEVAVRGTEQFRLLAKLLGQYLLSGCNYCSKLLGCSSSPSVGDAAKVAEEFLFSVVKPTGLSSTPWMDNFSDAVADQPDTRPAVSKKAQQSKMKSRGKSQLKSSKSAAKMMESSISDEIKACTAVEEDRSAFTAAASDSPGGNLVDVSIVEMVDSSGAAVEIDRSENKAGDDYGCTSDESLVVSSSIHRDDPHLVDDDGGWISIRSSANSQRQQRPHRPAVTYFRLNTRRPVRQTDRSDPLYGRVSHRSGDCPRINHPSVELSNRNASPKTLMGKTGDLYGPISVRVAVDASLHCSVDTGDTSHVKDCTRMRSSRTTNSPHTKYNPHKSLKYNSPSKKVLNSFSRPADIVSYRQSSLPITQSISEKDTAEAPVVGACTADSQDSNSSDTAGPLEDADPTEHSSLSDNASETTSHEDSSTLPIQQQLASSTGSPDSVFTFPRLPVQCDHTQPSMPFYGVPVQQGYPQQLSYPQGFPMMPFPPPVSYALHPPTVPHVPVDDLSTNEPTSLVGYSDSISQPSSAMSIQLPLTDSSTTYAYPSPHFPAAHYYSPTMFPPSSYYPSNFVFASRTPSPKQPQQIRTIVGPRDENEIIGAVRMQIEYYFSPQNLMHDVYLRRMMDHDGFVELQTIAQFPRMLKLGATANQILTAVQQSSLLDIRGSDRVNRTKNNLFEIQTASTSDILSTKVRAIEHPTFWVLQNASPVV